MANRVKAQFMFGSQEAIGCRCGWPVCVAIADEVVTPELKVKTYGAPVRMTVDRYFDCVVHGMWCQRLIVDRPTESDSLIIRRGSVLPLCPMDQQNQIYPWSQDVKRGTDQTPTPEA